MKLWQPLYAILRHELQCIFVRDPRRALLLVGAATLYLLLFGLLYQAGSLYHIPTTVLDEDRSATSRAFLQSVSDSERFRIDFVAINQEELQAYRKARHDTVAFTVPPHFERDLGNGLSAPVLMTIDGANLVVTSTASTAGIELAQAFSEQMAQKRFEKNLNVPPPFSAQRAHPIELSFRILGNPTISYLSFFVLGLALAAFQQGILLSVAASFLDPLRGRSPSEYAVPTPLRIAVKISPYLVSSLIGIGLLLYVAIHGVGIPLGAPSLMPLFALAGSFAFVLCTLATILCAAPISELTFTRISVCYTVPAFILSGFTWPIAAMPPLMQSLARLSPLTYVATPFRDYYLNGHSEALWTATTELGALGIVFFLIACLLHAQRVRQHVENG